MTNDATTLPLRHGIDGLPMSAVQTDAASPKPLGVQIINPGDRVIRGDGLSATFLRLLPGGVYGVFRYDEDNTPERVTHLSAFLPASPKPPGA